MPENPEKTIKLGSRGVPAHEKAELVGGVFSSVATKYDLMNDLMSMGVHRMWKGALVDWLAPRSGQVILDIAGGTGDVAHRIVRRAPGAEVTVLDSNEKMLGEGRRRAQEVGDETIAWVQGDATALPFSHCTFDACVISFGIRNFSGIQEGLDEAFRVLKTGGRLLVLEFSHVRNAGMRRLYDKYSYEVIPKIGEVVAGDRESYQYLIESIRHFPRQDRFAEMVRQSGFANVKHRNMTFGVAALHSGWKL